MASEEPLWLAPQDAIAINRFMVAQTGEPHLVRDEGLLAGAVSRPRHLYLYEGEGDAVALASCLLFAIACNHPFEQGNKRTAFAAALIFLENNGYRWRGDDDIAMAELIVAVIARERTEADFIAAFQADVAAD